jgi:uncharacterized membrane protein
MGENHFAQGPVALYGIVLLACAIAFTILAHTLIAHQGPDSALARALGRDFKGKVSLAAYATAVPLAFFLPGVSLAIYMLVAAMWLVPDPRIEKTVHV